MKTVNVTWNYHFEDEEAGEFLVQSDNYTTALEIARTVGDNPEYTGRRLTDWEAECSGLDVF